MCILGISHRKVNIVLCSNLHRCYKLRILLCVYTALIHFSPWGSGLMMDALKMKHSQISPEQCVNATTSHTLPYCSAPAPLNLTEDVVISLQIIGYVGVTISLVAMAITITTFIFLK